MAQERTHDYADPRSTEPLNQKFAKTNAVGLIEGFTVETDGTINVGYLLTQDGVLVQETTTRSVTPPAGHATLTRFDLVYAKYTYLPTSPAPTLSYHVVSGTAGVTTAPDIPSGDYDSCVPIALCTMAALGSAWTSCVPVPTARVENLQRIGYDKYKIIHGDRDSYLLQYGFHSYSGVGVPITLGYIASGTYADDTIVEATDFDNILIVSAGGKIYQIEELAGSTWTVADRTVKQLSDQMGVMQGSGWTSENLKALSDTIMAMKDNGTGSLWSAATMNLYGIYTTLDTHVNVATVGAHKGVNIALDDAWSVLTATQVEAALQEICGNGRVAGTTLYSLEDLKAPKLNAALTGTTTMVAQTTSGMATFNGGMTIDASDIDNMVFDSSIDLYRSFAASAFIPDTIVAPEVPEWIMDNLTPWWYNATQLTTQKLSKSIEAMRYTILDQVRVAVQNTDGNDHTVTVYVLSKLLDATSWTTIKTTVQTITAGTTAVISASSLALSFPAVLSTLGCIVIALTDVNAYPTGEIKILGSEEHFTRTRVVA